MEKKKNSTLLMTFFRPPPRPRPPTTLTSFPHTRHACAPAEPARGRRRPETWLDREKKEAPDQGNGMETFPTFSPSSLFPRPSPRPAPQNKNHLHPPPSPPRPPTARPCACTATLIKSQALHAGPTGKKREAPGPQEWNGDPFPSSLYSSAPRPPRPKTKISQNKTQDKKIARRGTRTLNLLITLPCARELCVRGKGRPDGDNVEMNLQTPLQPSFQRPFSTSKRSDKSQMH